uniref:Exocyst complex component Sec6 n=1 Tax=Ascaris lumbricoides TaxID=6252 RepID=A0A9J2PAF8_ASCLU
MDADAVQKEAYAAALVHVAQLLQRSDQLEKLDSLRKRADRKKAAVEAMLRTGVQSQLEGIRTAIGHLSSTVEDIKAVETNLQEIHDTLQRFPELKKKMAKLREANIRHDQYATAMEHLKHIYSINETIEQTHEYIVDGKLLLASKNIMELEHARDDLMFEVHKLQQGNADYEKNLLKTYFSEVEKLVQELAKQIWYICARCLEAVRGLDQGPMQLVTALRIIEREERIDKYYLDRRTVTNNFMPPGRPRAWRQKCIEVIAKTVRQRIEGNQLEDRSINKQWLARYLEVCRLVLVDDLTVAKSGAVPCFPPHYNIYDRFVGMYHNCISSRLREIASEKLEKNELVQLLSWVNAYGGDQMLGTPKLQINAAAMLADHPLLPRPTVTQLCDQFVEVTKGDMHEWLEKTLMQEKDDWYKHVRPEEESLGYFYTQLPSILFGMIEDTVSLAKEISLEVIPSVVSVSIDEFLNFANRYRDAFMAYKTKHFEDRSYFREFTATMIAVANNMDICVDSTDKLIKHIRLTMETDVVSEADGAEVTASGVAPTSSVHSPRGSAMMGVSRKTLLDKIDHLKKRWNLGLHSAVNTLLEEVFEDIAPHLAELLTKKWLSGSSAVETICMTLMDYNVDHTHLRPHIRCALLMEMQYRILGEYMIAVDNRRITLANYEDRAEAATLLRKDATRIREVFETLHSDIEMPFVDMSAVLVDMSEVLNLRDKSLLALETTSFVRKYPDIHVELLSALIQAREDMGRAEARSMAEETLTHTKYHPKGDAVFAKLFQACKTDSKRTLAFEETMQNMFATLTSRS